MTGEDASTPFEDVTGGGPTRRRRQRGSWAGWPYLLGMVASLATTLLVLLLLRDWSTVSGTLQLEVDQPGAIVYLDGKKWDVATPGKMKPLKIPIEEGNHEVRVVKPGFQPQTREFTFRKGKARPIIQVRLTPLRKNTQDDR